MWLRSPARRLYGAYFGGRRAVERALVRRPPPPSAFDPARVRRALLVCTGLIGDSVMCLPALKAAREVLPRAELVGLVTETSGTILAAAGCLDRSFLCDGAPLRLHPARRRSVRALERRLAAEDFGLAVIFLGDDYAPMITRLAVPHRVFVAESAFARLATVTYPIGSARTWGPQERLGAWRALGVDPAGDFPPLRASPPAASAVEARLRHRPRPWIVLHPYGSTPSQWWPLSSARSASRALSDRFGGTVLLVGGGARASPFDPDSPGTVDLRGGLSLDELIALIATSDCVVSTDSGPYHLAGALARPGVGLFRASRPEHAGRYATVASVLAPCLPECAARCRWDRCRADPCRQMASLAPEAVVDAAGSALRTA